MANVSGESSRPNRGPFWLAVLLGLAVGVGAFETIERSRLSVARLEASYGPKRYSEENEELLIRHFFHDRRYGFFVDVGAGHYMQGSNTYYLEHDLGWRGIAIDAIADYEADYRAHRPNTAFFNLFISDHSDDNADFFFAPNNRTRSSGIQAAVQGAGPVETRHVRTATLNDLLGANSITRFDFMSLDIELGEPKALAGLDIRRFHPALVCVEAHEPIRASLEAYFAANGYRRIDDYRDVDRRNWYYTPR